jgi:hypothetical protein
VFWSRPAADKRISADCSAAARRCSIAGVRESRLEQLPV